MTGERLISPISASMAGKMKIATRCPISSRRQCLRVLDIAPTTLTGLRALCEFGAELMNSQHTLGSDMGAYTPGGSIGVSAPSAEELFITALNRAAATLLPPRRRAPRHMAKVRG